MLHTRKLLDEMTRKRDHLLSYQRRHGDTLGLYRAALASLRERYPSMARLEAAQRATLAAQQEPEPLGARPTAEYDAWLATGERVPALRFGERFDSHEQSRAWAERLRGVTTFAVDGSQLPPWRDASAPVALVQAGLYENPHQPPQPYVKDVVVELLTPEELTGDDPDLVDARTGDDMGYSNRFVQLRRFELEVETIIARMEHHQRRAAEGAASGKTAPLVVAFYDGSLIVSFALKSPPPYRERYVGAALRLLGASRRCGVPLLGYIDTSYARDIVVMLRGLASAVDTPGPSALSALSRPSEAPAATPNLPREARGLSDPLLWHGALDWGDRSPAFISARYDLGRMGYSGYSGEGAEGAQDSGNGDIGFVYFQAALDRPPARIEFPRWLLDDGLLDRVLDVVRAEVIAGTGYPYPIEAADAVAVISAPDRAQFYALFQEFAEREHIHFSFSRKALSKSRRRI